MLAAATVDEPKDAAGRVLGAFAGGGAAFFAVTFAGAAIGIRRQPGALDPDLYAQLALVDVSDRTVRRVTGGHRRLAYVYVVFGVLTTALLLLGIGLADDRLRAPLLYGALALVLVWALIAYRSLSSLSADIDAIVEPLGLHVTSTPRVSGRGRLVGPTTLAGQRHGRGVTIEQRTTTTTTSVQGARPAEAITRPADIAELTGLEPARWRGVRAEAGADGVIVRRRANGAARWVLEDLLLAEILAGGR